MSLALNKKSLWIIVIWFAVLQTFSPFIHGHFEVDSPAQGVGLHIHMPAFEQTITLASDKVHVLQNVSNTIHTIGVDKALVKSVDLLPPPCIFSIARFVFICASHKIY